MSHEDIESERIDTSKEITRQSFHKLKKKPAREKPKPSWEYREKSWSKMIIESQKRRIAEKNAYLIMQKEIKNWAH